MKSTALIRIRPATGDDDAILTILSQPSEAGEFNTFEPDPEFVRGGVEPVRFIIEYPDGRPIGDMSYFGVVYGPNVASTAWKIGITVLRSQRGLGHGSRAQRMLAEHLLATTGSARVEADTDVENVAEQRALERAGFRREGVLRQAQYRGGTWHDMVVYALTRADLARSEGGEPGESR